MKKTTFALVLFSTVLVTGCQGNDVKRTLGINRNSPDEFMVISRPPLTVPPDFVLPPPSSGVATETPAISTLARDRLLKNDASPSQSLPQAPSKGLSVLLQKTGANKADPNIRTTLDQESQIRNPELEEEEKGLLTGIRESLTPKSRDPLVNIDKEEERIQENQQQGKPITEGEIPTQESGKKGLLNELLGF